MPELSARPMTTVGNPSTSLTTLFKTLWRSRQLIALMTRREAMARYKGSIFGIAWSLVTPILMMIVYTFVFSVVFKSKWEGGGSNSKTQFAVLLFTGMIVHGLFAEIFNKAPGIILGNVNYVKRVVFPIEILSIISAGSALFSAFINVLVLSSAFYIFNGYIPWTAPLVVLVLGPLVIGCIGMSWILSAAGVFLRDISQSVGIFTTIMTFISPVFFPVSAIPAQFQAIVKLNPLTFIIEQSRNVLIWGVAPDWTVLGTYYLGAILLSATGYIWFQKARKGFADVL